MQIAAVTVTYSNRAHYLNKVVKALLSSGVNVIVIVDNGSPHDNYQVINKLAREHGSTIHLVRLEKNTGSANGYKVGIQYVLKNLPGFFLWLLDDDNQPEKNTLSALTSYWNKRNLSAKKENLALLACRNDRPKFKEAVKRKDPFFMLGRVNSFLGFHIVDLLKKEKNTQTLKSNQTGRVAVAPYGGLFFHPNIVDKIGLPDTSFYLYADDYDFSYRITARGGYIELVSSSEITDLETSFHLKKEKKSWNRFFKTDSKIRIFYSVRNGIWFERRNFVSNPIVYYLNLVCYITLLNLQFLLQPKQTHKLKIIYKAVIAGISNNKKNMYE
jgi:GT2 family glycosyltransferase